MELKRFPELHTFLSTYFPDVDLDSDEEATQAFISASSAECLDQVVAQARLVIVHPAFSVVDLGTEANRWFGDLEEARAWLQKILNTLEKAQTREKISTKDSNGTPLSEGDSVSVIKDLKVKGGSSDLKRGTIIKKIHLTHDPELIECRVDGSTLVLKTCFLKKT
jgi:protein PhnA